MTTGDVPLGPGPNLRCRGKGRKHRATPLTRHRAVLRAWLSERRSGPGTLFPTRARRRLAPTPSNASSPGTPPCRRQCPSLAGKKVTPHTLRHTAAMELLHAGVDTSAIALWLGHEGPAATQLYLQDITIKEEALAGAGPAPGPAATGRLTPPRIPRQLPLPPRPPALDYAASAAGTSTLTSTFTTRSA